MKVIAVVQGGGFFGAIALAANTHNVLLGITVYATVAIMHAAIGGVLAVMRRVRNYRNRIKTIEMVRSEVFKNQYGSKPRTSYGYQNSRTYTVG